jgi:hypothetical protein
MATCPAGHTSTAEDYCDTCGAAMTAAAPASEPARDPAPCPACGDPVEDRYCESCGYDVEAGKPAAATSTTLTLSADRAHWERMVGSGEPAFPSVSPTLTFELSGDRATLGRASGSAPTDVTLALTGTAADAAVSSHQCEFVWDGTRWSVRDLDSANGTWINDADEPLAEGAAHVLADGDRIRIGAWTCLTVHTASAS